MKLGSLKRVPLREVWKNEARDFSKWLATKEGISLLGEAVGFEIEPTETESAVGRYSVDILGKVSGTDQTVVIENQIEDSNHDHLGKLITYAAGKGASCAIWIVKKANDEHRRAVEFLNETSRSTIGYFLLEIEAWKIGESEPAPKFNIVESPNDWARSMIPDSEGTEVTQLYLRYWTSFCSCAENDASFRSVFKLRKPLRQNWMDFALGRSGIWLSAAVSEWHHRLKVSAVISVNSEYYEAICTNVAKLRSALGVEILEGSGKQMKTLSVTKDFDVYDEKSWPDAFSWYSENLIKMRKAIFDLIDVNEG